MTISFDQAKAAKNALRFKLGRPAWLRGIGVGLDENGHFVKVNVKEIIPEVSEAVPREVEGVPVQVEAVGEIVAAEEQTSPAVGQSRRNSPSTAPEVGPNAQLVHLMANHGQVVDEHLE